ncbi:MAG: hypothetical protein ACTHM2_06605 [Afipia sp.]|jgi:hypothetical protein
MPYALFSDDAKISKAYKTEAEVWKHATETGLVTDVAADAEKPTPRRILDNGYEIRPCADDPPEQHDPKATDIVLPKAAKS